MAADAPAAPMGRRGWFPTGGTLADDVFARRHRTLRALLALHVPVLLLVAANTGQSAAQSAIAVLPVLAATVACGFGSRATRGVVVAVGLAACSAAIIGMSGGIAESHYHVLAMIAFVALYQDWIPFVGFAAIAAVGYAVCADVAPHAVFDKPAVNRPGIWAGVHIGFLLAEAFALVVFWKATEVEQNRAADLASSLTRAELERTREQTEARQAATDLLSNLARRNQSLLDRQLQRIDALEQVERDPEALAELFSLDHLATRMRRNAESLLVLSGGATEVPKPWGSAVLLSEICRGAMAEVEDYTRVDVALTGDVLVDSNVVGDLVHLAAELIENATAFSPPTTRVLVSGNMSTHHGYVFAISDAGIGMNDADLADANATLNSPDAAVIEAGGMLGLHVVARLASRYGIRAWLQHGVSGGLSAMVALPASCLAGGAPDHATPLPQTAAPAAGSPQLDPELSSAAFPAPAPAPQPIAAPLPIRTPVPVAAPVAAPVYVEPQAVPAPAAMPEPVFAAAASVVPLAEPIVPAQPAGPQNLTAAGLQRRIPKASLAAPLAAGPDSGTHVPVDSGIEPARARSVLAAYTGGVSRGRDEATEIDQSADRGEPAGHTGALAFVPSEARGDGS